jgi:site-specific DNA recombinase
MERAGVLRAAWAEGRAVTTTSAHRRAGTRRPAPANGTPVVRVAIYTRKSVDKGTSGDFGSIDAQRAAVASYVASQAEKGWRALPELYDDGNNTGANIDRPAFQRLLTAVRERRVDIIGVYRLDRLSRSQADFVRLLEILDEHGVRFFSVSESFDTSTPHGRFAMGLLMQVAQLEREVTAVRVRDKVIASRRLGIWTGGRPVLGYDTVAGKLVVNEPEAAIVRELFAMYLEHASLNAVVAECQRRGITNKTFVNRRGERVQGGPIAKTTLRALLSNPLFVGRINADGEAVPGDQKAIVDEQTWDAVQALLDEHGAPGRDRPRTEWKVPLLGLLRCAVCGSAMTHSATRRHGRAYGSFVCVKAQKQGAAACPGSRAPAPQMVAAVVERIRAIGRDPGVFDATLAACRARLAAAPAARDAERRRLRSDRERLGAERAGLLHALEQPGVRPGTLAARLSEIDALLASMQEISMGPHSAEASPGGGFGGPEALRGSLRRFGPVWDALLPAEQARLLALLIETVTFDARSSSVTIAFRPTGILKLARPEETP